MFKRTKIILIGDRNTYHLLKNNDPEFNKLFKVNVDFSEEFERDNENVTQYAKLVVGIQREEKTTPLSIKAVERIIEHASRMVDSNQQISLHIGDLRDLILEAEYYYQLRKAKRGTLIRPEDIQKALDARMYRDDQYRQKIYEDILDKILILKFVKKLYTQAVLFRQIFLIFLRNKSFLTLILRPQLLFDLIA